MGRGLGGGGAGAQQTVRSGEAGRRCGRPDAQRLSKRDYTTAFTPHLDLSDKLSDRRLEENSGTVVAFGGGSRLCLA